MPRLQIEATELKNTDVSFVSLVKHGANRIPFRIVKEDQEAMLDLGKISRSMFRKADAKPGIVAVLVSKGSTDTKLWKDTLQPALEGAGLVFTQKSETDDGVVFAQPGVEAGGRDGVLRLSQDVALVVGGLADMPTRMKKEFAPWCADSTDFMAVLNTQGFFPGMALAMEALQGTVYNIMKDAEEPAAAASLVEAAIDNFKAYVMPCVSGIPVRAFKADAVLQHEMQKAEEVILVGVKPTHETEELSNKIPGADTAVAASGLGAGNSAAGTAYDVADPLIRALKDEFTAKLDGILAGLKKAEAPQGVDVKMEPSLVNQNQEPSRPTGHGGKNTMPGMPAPETAQGTDTKPERAVVENAQEGTRPTGHGGKMPISGEAPMGTDVKPETSPVNDAQGRGDATVAGLMKQMEALFAQNLTPFRRDVLAQMAAVQKDVGVLGKRIDGVEAHAKKTEEALSGTALGMAVGDEEDPRATLRRGAARKADAAPPLLDTGLSRRAAAA